jgi:hypothetical protein
MNLEYKHLLPADFPEQSKVWVYQASRLLTLSESLEAEEMINSFCQEWQSHGDQVRAFGTLLFGQFLVLMTDETEVKVGGCSTDSSVRFVRELGAKFNVDFFNRTNLAFIIKDKVELLPMNQLNYAVDNNFITPDTLYFNNTVLTKQQLEDYWLIPVKESWIAKKVGEKLTA